MDAVVDRKEYIPSEWEDVPCPLCNETRKKLYERFGAKLQYTYVLCLRCGNIYESPRPKYDEKFLQAAYGDYFLFNENYRYRDSKYNNFDKELTEIVKFDARRESILDVGSAMGDFLRSAKNYYSRVYGAEISKKMADFSSGKLNVSVFNRQFDAIDTGEKFSCIHLSHIIEHIPDPGSWLRKARQLLADNGVVVICVPNMYSLARIVKLYLARMRLRDPRWGPGWRTPDHLFEPTVRGMRWFLNHHDYRILSIYSYSRSNMISEGIFARIFHRGLKWGSNLRIYARPG